MKYAVINFILCSFFLCLALASAAKNGTEPMKDDNQGRLIPGISSILARLAIRGMMLKLVRAFTQYFVDIFLGEIIGARGLSDEKWSFQWPSWLTTGINNE